LTKEIKSLSATYSITTTTSTQKSLMPRYEMIIFSHTSHKYLTSQDYATNKPYQNNIVLKSLKIAFGSMMNIRNAKHYGYSHKDYCKEHEVPAHMVAVATTAVGFFSLSFFTLSDPHSRTMQLSSTSFTIAMATLSSLLLSWKVSFVAI